MEILEGEKEPTTVVLYHPKKGWFPFSRKVSYRGGMLNGVRHGHGVEFDEDGKKIYEGQYACGRRHGQGTEFSKGRFPTYIGEWREGVRSVHGTSYRETDWKQYEGEWLNNVYHGKGILYNEGYSRSNHVKYRGEFEHGKFHGEGTLFDSQCGHKVYEGQFENGMRHGRGILYYPKLGNPTEFLELTREGFPKVNIRDGSVAYDGEWFKDKRHGVGTTRFPNDKELGKETGFSSEKITTTWRNGIPSCKNVTITRSNGLILYKGSLRIREEYEYFTKRFVERGTGVFFSLNGERKILDGEWRDFAPNGECAIFREDGTLHYLGQCVRGRKEGHGKSFEADGETVEFEGHWNDGYPDGDLAIKEYEDGSVYSGSMVKGVAHGFGSLRKGEVRRVGIFEKDKPVPGKTEIQVVDAP